MPLFILSEFVFYANLLCCRMVDKKDDRKARSGSSSSSSSSGSSSSGSRSSSSSSSSRFVLLLLIIISVNVLNSKRVNAFNLTKLQLINVVEGNICVWFTIDYLCFRGSSLHYQLQLISFALTEEQETRVEVARSSFVPR